MVFTIPPTAVVGAVVDEEYTNVFSDNDNWFNGLLPAPGAANQVPISTSTSAAAWGFTDTPQIANGAGTATTLGTGSVTSAKFAAGNVTEGKLTGAVAELLLASGPIGWFRTAAEIPTGWTRESNLDGRMPVGAGTTFSTTFTEATNYGSSWSHLHAVAIDTGGPLAVIVNIEGGSQTEAAPQHHTHAITGNTASTAWQIPVRAVVFARKN